MYCPDEAGLTALQAAAGRDHANAVLMLLDLTQKNIVADHQPHVTVALHKAISIGALGCIEVIEC